MRSEGKRTGGPAGGYPTSGNYRREQEGHAENAGAGYGDLPRMALKHPKAHDDGDRDGHRNREDAPRAVGEGVDHHNAESGQGHKQNKEHGDHRHQSREGADLGARDVGERAATTTDRGDEHSEILHASGQHSANQQP